jgi:hypothetical protein
MKLADDFGVRALIAVLFFGLVYLLAFKGQLSKDIIMVIVGGITNIASFYFGVQSKK